MSGSRKAYSNMFASTTGPDLEHTAELSEQLLGRAPITVDLTSKPKKNSTVQKSLHDFKQKQDLFNHEISNKANQLTSKYEDLSAKLEDKFKRTKIALSAMEELARNTEQSIQQDLSVIKERVNNVYEYGDHLLNALGLKKSTLPSGVILKQLEFNWDHIPVIGHLSRQLETMATSYEQKLITIECKYQADIQELTKSNMELNRALQEIREHLRNKPLAIEQSAPVPMIEDAESTPYVVPPVLVSEQIEDESEEEAVTTKRRKRSIIRSDSEEVIQIAKEQKVENTDDSDEEVDDSEEDNSKWESMLTLKNFYIAVKAQIERDQKDKTKKEKLQFIRAFKNGQDSSILSLKTESLTVMKDYIVSKYPQFSKLSLDTMFRVFQERINKNGEEVVKFRVSDKLGKTKKRRQYVAILESYWPEPDEVETYVTKRL